MIHKDVDILIVYMFIDVINKIDVRFLIVKLEIKIVNIIQFSHS